MNGLNRTLILTSAIFCLETLCWAEQLTVRVVDAKTGAPVQATVNAIGTLPKLESVRTNQAGVAIIDFPSLERVFLTVLSSTHGEKCVAEEETMEGLVVVTMEPSLRVYGVVRDPSGNPLREATVKVVYRDDPKCRIRFERHDVVTNERGEYVLRNVDVARDPTIVVRHDQYAERVVTKAELEAAPSGPSANTKEMDFYLVARP